MAAVTSAVAAGVTAASAIGGAIKGARGTPGQRQTSQTQLAKKTPQQLQMEQASMDNFRRQQEMAGQFEQGIQGADQLRDPAIQAYLQQISGEAFQATPQELAQIQTVRDAMVNLGTQDINRFTQQGLTQATSGAAARGLRGQAMGSLRGQVLESANQQVGNIANNANLFAGQQAMNQPYQRVAAQQSALQQGLTYGDILRQQAQQNRQMLQNPILMQQLQNERLNTATRTQTTPGEKGGVWGAITGGLTGAATGLQTAAGIGGSINNLQGMGLFQGGQQQQQPQQMAFNYQGYDPNKMIV